MQMCRNRSCRRHREFWIGLLRNRLRHEVSRDGERPDLVPMRRSKVRMAIDPHRCPTAGHRWNVIDVWISRRGYRSASVASPRTAMLRQSDASNHLPPLLAAESGCAHAADPRESVGKKNQHSPLPAVGSGWSLSAVALEVHTTPKSSNSMTTERGTPISHKSTGIYASVQINTLG
jgi:hypothetical protein